MNYQKIYNNIVNNAKERVLEGYSEKHHIIPKCIGGDNLKENIVILTAREHYILHLLLIHIYPENKSLKHAFWMMSHRVDGTYTNSKIYSEIKEFISKELRNNVGTPEAISKMAKSRKGQQLWLGKKHTKESRKKQSEAAKKRKIQNAVKKVYQYDLNDIFVKEWNSALKAAKFIGVSSSGISACAHSRQKTAGNFKWKLTKK